jgi:hypothetical protein
LQNLVSCCKSLALAGPGPVVANNLR